jgi:hypothetical protein
MRKRSEVTPTKEPENVPRPPMTANEAAAYVHPHARNGTSQWVPPDTVSVIDGTVWVKCECGQKFSHASYMRNSGKCILCNREIDPKGELTPERIEALKHTKLPMKEEPKKEAPKPGIQIPGEEAVKKIVNDARVSPRDASAPMRPDISDLKSGVSFAARVGSKFTVTYGEMQFSPKQYHSFRVGPFTVEGVVGPDETLQTAMARAYEQLEMFAMIEFKRATEDYITKLEQLAKRIG